MAAVKIRRAYKHYGRGATLHQVLDNLNMTVPEGSIYGLLGASGCGKTTILNCIVGSQKLNSGEMWVLGGRPGTKKCGVPGPKAGHMPQEVALVGEFTVRSALFYFGWISGMNDGDIEERLHFLSELLDLPSEDQFVKNLSGGQQRRVSLAATLVHSPELLILDEPTVGLDPVLRARIWQHFMEITADHSVTIIITTHYIEEVSQAQRIGLLRNGKLLAENAPLQVMTSLNCSNLEEVFLILSQKQENGELQTLSDIADAIPLSSPDQDKDILELSRISNKENKGGKMKLHTHFSIRMKALLAKNFARLIRNYGGLFFIILFPMLYLTLYFLGIGSEPWGLKLAIVNEELGNKTNCVEYRRYNPTIPTLKEDGSCELAGLSCNYLDRIDQEKIYYKDFETAINDVKKGSLNGVLHFRSNFSRLIQERYEMGMEASIAAVEGSDIWVHMDMSNFVIKGSLQRQLYKAILDLGSNIMRICNRSEKVANLPLKFNDPIFGDNNQSYLRFLTPGLLLSLVFFLAVLITSLVIIMERREGVWDRSLVAGVTTTEILLSHILSLIPCMMIQDIVIIVMSFTIFHAPCNGDITTAVVLILLQGLNGLCFGFLVSTVCDDYTAAFYSSMGIFFPYLFLCGMIWPVEALPQYLLWISFCLPGTIPIISIRNILERGKSILELTVYSGFLISVVWVVMQILLCIIILKIRSK